MAYRIPRQEVNAFLLDLEKLIDLVSKTKKDFLVMAKSQEQEQEPPQELEPGKEKEQ